MFVKVRMLFLQEKSLGAKPLPWQYRHMHQCVSSLKYIAGAKFQSQCRNISRDILDLVICLHTATTFDVITYFLLT